MVRVRHLLATELVGRDHELATLSAQHRRALAGTGSITIVIGEAGVGKTRLVRAVADVARSAGCSVLVGGALDGSVEPYRPLVEAMVGIASAEAAAVVESLAGRSGTTEPEPEAHGVVLADQLLRAVGRSGVGTVLVIEDLHWAEPETIAMMRDAATLVSRHPVMVLTTARPGTHGVDDVVETVRSRAGIVVDLGALGGEDVDEMVAACLGGSAPPEVARFVRAQSDGVPLHVEELLAGLSAAGALVESDRGWTTHSRIVPVVPATFGASVRRRTAGLRPQARAVIEAAAVLGREFDWRLLVDLVDGDATAVDRGLNEAVEAQLLRVENGRLRFRHALTREAVLDQIEPHRRAAVARRALAALDRSDRVDGSARRDLAIGLAEQAGDGDRAAALMVAAARNALERGALASAAEAVARADRLAADEDIRLEIDEVFVETHALAGHTDLAAERGERAIGELARRPASGPRRIRLLLALARAEIVRGEWAAAGRHAAAARVLHDATPDAGALARILAVEAHVAINLRQAEAAVEAGRAAIEAARRADLPDVRCEALEVLGRAARFVEPRAAAAHFEEALAVATAHGLGAWRLRAMTELAIDAVFHDGTVETLHVARSVADEVGAPVTMAVIDLHLAGIHLVTGRPDPGFEFAVRCADACRRYRLSMLPIALLHVAAGHALSGEADSAEALVSEAIAVADGDPQITAAAWGWVRGDLAFVDGDHERWLHCLDRAMDLLRGLEGTVPFPFRAMWPLLGAVAGRDPAVALAEVRASVAPAVLGNRWPLDMAEAVHLGRTDPSAADLAALDAERGAPQGEWAAWQFHRVRLAVAPAALADGWGRPDRWLREAEVFFHARELPKVAAHCRRLMRAAGMPVHRRGRGASSVPPELRVHGVSSREMDVLHLIGERLSNREIAQSLHLSVRTVEKHVASLLTKTGTESRRELGGLLARIVGELDPV